MKCAYCERCHMVGKSAGCRFSGGIASLIWSFSPLVASAHDEANDSLHDETGDLNYIN